MKKAGITEGLIPMMIIFTKPTFQVLLFLLKVSGLIFDELFFKDSLSSPTSL